MKTPKPRLGGPQRNTNKHETEDDEDTVGSEVEDFGTPTVENVKRSYDFNAPQFFDFTKEPTIEADKWFDHLEDERNNNDHDNANIFGYIKEKPAAKNIKSYIEQNKSRRSSIHSMIMRKRATKRPSMTIPKPFKFHTSRGVSKKAAPSSPYVPLALKLQKMQSETPERFYCKPKVIERILKNELTLPKSPKLSTKLRAKHTKGATKSSEEIAVENIKKIEPFKAQPVNRKILDHKQEFVPPATALTIPMSPAIQKPKLKVIPEEKPVLVKANPMPDLSKSFKPKITRRTLEVPEYSLPGDKIHAQKQQMLAKKQELEQKKSLKAREFKATPVGDLDKIFEPKPTIKVTEPKPFDLKTEKRGEIYQKQFEEKVAEEMKPVEFHAQPFPNVEPFQPQRSQKPLTEIQEFASHTSTRLKQRKLFEEEKERRQNEEQEILRQQELEQQECENMEIKKLRRKLVHKAQPVRSFNFVNVKPSTKKLTEPQTPQFIRRQKKYIGQPQ